MDIVRAPQSRSYQIVDLVVFRTRIEDSVFLEDLLTQLVGHIAHDFLMRHGTDIAQGDRTGYPWR